MAAEQSISLYIVNQDPTCVTTIQSNVSFTSCSQTFIIRISAQSNASGPFDIYSGSTGTTAIYSNLTRTQLVAGVSITLYNSDPACIPATPTPTPSVTATPTVTPTVTPSISVTPSETPTQTPTPSVTTTPGATPTVTPTVTPTETPDASPTPTPTVTPTITPSPSSVGGLAYLFIEPQSGAEEIGYYMFETGGTAFYGFTNFTSPDTTSDAQFDVDMNLYVDFSGWTAGLTFPAVESQIAPTSSGGLDSYGNAITAYNFTTHQTSGNTIIGSGWFTWIIPTGTTNGGYQTIIDVSFDGTPNVFTPVNMDSTLYSRVFNYTGSTIPNDTYRVYSTFVDQTMYINNSNTLYFKGNSVI
jgi:hypothetical protein